MALSPSESHTGTPEERASRSRKESPAFLHDQNAHIDQKILKLRAKGGWEYYGLYWACIETMRSDSGLRINIDSVEGVAFGFRVEVDYLRDFLLNCVQFGLFAEDSRGFSSPALVSRIERYQGMIEQKKSAGRASGDKRAKSVQQDANGCSTGVERVLNTNKSLLNTSVSGVEHPQSNLIQSNLIQSNITESNTEPVSPPSDYAELEPLLTPASDPLVANSTLFMTTGKRPMKKYPNLWITTKQLSECATLYENSGIPPDQYHLGFRFVAAKLDKMATEGKSLNSTDAYGWLIGFGLTQALEQRGKTLNVKRQEKYLEGAQR